MNSTTAVRTIAALRNMFAHYGIPEQLVSDNGPHFISEEMHQFLATNGVKHIRSAPYHPSTNGAVERLVQTVKHALKSGHQADSGNFSAAVSHNTTCHYRSYACLTLPWT